MKAALLLGIVVSLARATVPTGASVPGIELDHVWIMVSPDAPERSALERAGFEISKDVNHHEGTGTSSITVEFENTYLELVWPDPKVPVSSGMWSGRQRSLTSANSGEPAAGAPSVSVFGTPRRRAKLCRSLSGGGLPTGCRRAR